MRVYRQTYTRGGEQRRVGRWYVELRDDGRRLRFPGFSDHRATQALGRQLERLLDLKAVGEPPDRLLARSIENWPVSLRQRCAKLGMLSASHAAGLRPLTDLLADFEAHLKAKDRTARHVRKVLSDARDLAASCGFRRWSDLRADVVERDLRRRREAGLAVRTSNHKLTALREFSRWVVGSGLAVEDPLRTLKALNHRVDPRRERRSLSEEELGALIAATRGAPARAGLSGADRALVYVLAAETGLRSAEIASLKVGSLELGESPYVRLAAAASKRRRDDVLPLRPATAAALAEHVRGRLPSSPVFVLPDRWRPAVALQEDLKAAGIDYVDDSGRVFDFHSLRVQFVSSLVRAGVDARTVQKLARHSTPNLTLGVYTRLGRDAERQALERLPSLASGLVPDDAASNGSAQRRAVGDGVDDVSRRTEADRPDGRDTGGARRGSIALAPTHQR